MGSQSLCTGVYVCVSVRVSGGFLTDAGSLFDAERVLLLCLSVCECGQSVSQLLQGLECCIRSAAVLSV